MAVSEVGANAQSVASARSTQPDNASGNTSVVREPPIIAVPSDDAVGSVDSVERRATDGRADGGDSDAPDASEPLLVRDGDPDVCSMQTKIRSRLLFKNDCGFDVEVSWIDFRCREVVYRSMPPGEEWDEGTYLTHAWRVRRRQDHKLLQQVVAMSAEGSTVRACGDHTVAQDESPATQKTPERCAAEPQPAADPPACSVNAKTAETTVTFFNNCEGAAVALYWLDYDCQERPYGLLNVGQTRRQPTFVSHTWRIRDAATHALYREFTPRSPTNYLVGACVCEQPE